MAGLAHLPMEASDAALLERAAKFVEFPTLAELGPQPLRGISARHGVDFATALLFDRVRRSPQHAQFIERIERWQERTPGKISPGSRTIAIVPASFFREKPHSGADGRVIRAAAEQFGLRCELVPVHSTGTLAQNSRILLDWLAARGNDNVILVSLCKGGADVKFALAQPDAAHSVANVRAWVNVCGTLNGSPVARWLLANRARFFATWLFFKCHRLSLDFLSELSPSPQSPLAAPLHLPPGLSLVNVIGFPLRRHLTNSFMRRCHQVVSRHGPNDGGVLLADVCRLPGALYPVWGADHYLRPEAHARRIIAAIFHHLLADDIPATLSPVGETPATDQTVRTISV